MKIVTALANPRLNKELAKIENIEILAPDIQYQDGVIEILDEKKNIDVLILSEVLSGSFNIKEFIIEIKNRNNNLKIIIILENKKEELENFLISKGIFDIYYNNEIEIEKMIEIIQENKNENCSKIIKKEKNEIVKYRVKRKNKKTYNKLKKDGIIISILGTHESGKSIFSINLAKSIKNKKILLIDFDLLNNSINSILGIKKYPNKRENDIVKINKNLFLLSAVNIIFKNKDKITNSEIKELLQKLKMNFDYIIIDTSSECFFDATRFIIKNSNKCIFLLEANLLEINKAKKILSMYLENWYIDKNNINIVLNKYNKNAIDFNILKNIFSDFKMLGKINYDDYYNLLINKNFNIIFKNKKIKKQYKIILDNLLKDNYKICKQKMGEIKNANKFIRRKY